MKIYNLANKFIIQMTCDFQFEPRAASLMICEDRLVRAVMARVTIHLSNLSSSDLRVADESHRHGGYTSVLFFQKI